MPLADHIGLVARRIAIPHTNKSAGTGKLVADQVAGCGNHPPMGSTMLAEITERTFEPAARALSRAGKPSLRVQ